MAFHFHAFSEISMEKRPKILVWRNPLSVLLWVAFETPFCVFWQHFTKPTKLQRGFFAFYGHYEHKSWPICQFWQNFNHKLPQIAENCMNIWKDSRKLPKTAWRLNNSGHFMGDFGYPWGDFGFFWLMGDPPHPSTTTRENPDNIGPPNQRLQQNSISQYFLTFLFISRHVAHAWIDKIR